MINLATGLGDAERVTVAFLVGGAALDKGKGVAMFLTKEAVRLGLPGHAEGSPATAACPWHGCSSSTPKEGGELLVCPICFSARKLEEGGLVSNARLGGATPLWEWIGEGATVFSY